MALSNKKPRQRKNRTFSNINRLVHNLCILINKEIENDYNDVYPDELEPKKKNRNRCKALFYDLAIDVRNRRFTSKLLQEIDVLYHCHCYICIATYYLNI